MRNRFVMSLVKKKDTHGMSFISYAYSIEVFAVGITIAALIMASFFTFPSADDYDYSILTHEAAMNGNLLDVIGAAVDTHIEFVTSWLALYSPAVLQSLQPGIFGDQYYWLTCPFLLLSTFFGFAVLARSLVKYVLQVKDSSWIPVAGFLWLFFVLTMPSPSQGLYWWNGGVNYMPFWSLVVWDIALMIKYYCGEGRAVPTIIVASIVSFIAAGGTQINSFALVLMLVYLCFLCAIKKKKYLGVAPLLVSVGGFFAMAMHPGTAARKAAIGVDMSVPDTFFLALKALRNHCIQWINLELILFFCLMLPLFLMLFRKSSMLKQYCTVRTALIFMVLSLSFLLAIHCVPAYSMASEGPGRLLNAVYAMFVFLAMVELFIIFGALYSNARIEPNKVVRERTMLAIAYGIVAVMFLFVMPNNLTAAMKELTNGSLAAFHQEMQERRELVEESDKGDVAVPALKHRPSLTFFNDIESSPEDWKNKSYSLYFSLKSIRTSEDKAN